MLELLHMSISIEEVDRIAKLARLKFNEQEKQKLQQELSAILDYVDQLKEVQGQIEPVLFDDETAVNLMRDDVAVPVEDPEVFIDQAPAREGKFVKVKSILE